MLSAGELFLNILFPIVAREQKGLPRQRELIVIEKL